MGTSTFTAFQSELRKASKSLRSSVLRQCHRSPRRPTCYRLVHHDLPFVGREIGANQSLGSEGLGIPRRDIDQVIARAMARFDAGRQQALSIREVTNIRVADLIVGKLGASPAPVGTRRKGPPCAERVMTH